MSYDPEEDAKSYPVVAQKRLKAALAGPVPCEVVLVDEKPGGPNKPQVIIDRKLNRTRYQQ